MGRPKKQVEVPQGLTTEGALAFLQQQKQERADAVGKQIALAIAQIAKENGCTIDPVITIGKTAVKISWDDLQWLIGEQS